MPMPLYLLIVVIQSTIPPILYGGVKMPNLTDVVLVERTRKDFREA